MKASTTEEKNNQLTAPLDNLRSSILEMGMVLPQTKREPQILRIGSTTELQLWILKARQLLTTKSEPRPSGGLGPMPGRLTHKGCCRLSRGNGLHGSMPQIVGVNYLPTTTPDAVLGNIQHTARATLPTATPLRGNTPIAGAGRSR